MSEFTPERAAKNYNYGAIQTPFARLKQEYDAPLGESVRQAYTWRVLSISLLALSLFLVLLLVLIVSLPKEHVFFVGITPQNGQSTLVGELTHKMTFTNETSLQTIRHGVK